MTLRTATDDWVHTHGQLAGVGGATDKVDVWQHAHRDLIQALKPHLHWLSRTLANRPHAIVVSDRNGMVLFGLAEGGEDLAGLGLLPGTVRRDSDGGETATMQAMRLGGAAVIRAEVTVTPDGSRQAQAVPIRCPDGVVVGAIEINQPKASARDLTLLLSHVAWIVEQQLANLVGAFLQRRLLAFPQALPDPEGARLQTLCDDVLRVIAHDLRNPLAVLMMGAGILAVKGAEPDDPKVDCMLQAAERLEQLVANLVDLMQFTLGSGRSLPKPSSLGTLLPEAMHQPSMRALGRHMLVTEPDTGWPLILADQRLMVQSLAALMSSTAALAPGDLVWSGHVVGEQLTLHLSTGAMGWNPVWSCLLEMPICQCEELAPGSGLGLALARRLIVVQGGSLAFEQADDGAGQLTVTLPLAPSSRRHT